MLISSVNDVLTASVAGAIDSYLRSKGAVVPQSDDIGIDVLILNYGDGDRFGMVMDGKIASGPHRIIRRFASEFGKLVLLVLMPKW